MGFEQKIEISLNQNLWGLVITYAALGAAEYWDLKWLCRLSIAGGIIMSISILFTFSFYTWRYCHNKVHKP